MSRVSIARRLVLIVIAALAFAQSGRAQDQPTASSLASQAYGLLSTQPAEAASLFRQALSLDSTNLLWRRQLGYLLLSQGDKTGALEQLTVADGIVFSDTIAMQRAYLLAGAGRTDEARDLFSRLRESRNAEIAQQADREYLAMTPEAARSRHWTHLYAAPYYDTRWKTTFYGAHIMHGYALDERRLLSIYGKASVSGDNKSTATGLAPLIVSDNTLLLALGFRLNPFAGMMVDVQQGVAFDLMDKGAGRSSRGDFRAVAMYGAGVYAPFTLHDHLTMPMAPFADVYTSVGYYSRYRNGIGYVQARAGLHAVEVSRTSLDVYARVDLARDTEKEYYNNILEAGGGVRLTPNVDWGLYFVAEYRRGNYLDVSSASTALRSARYDAAYHSGRFFILFDRTF